MSGQDVTSRASTVSHLPVRTCVGCRERADQPVLLRAVLAGPDAHSVVPDPHRRHAGRGAWLHPTMECLDLAERRRAFPRALRTAGPLDLAPLRAYVAQEREPTVSGKHAGAKPSLPGSGSEADEPPMSTQR